MSVSIITENEGMNEMSYLKYKLGFTLEKQIKDYLIEEGFTPYNDVFPNTFLYYAQGNSYEVSIEVNTDKQTFNYDVDYSHGGGTVKQETFEYENDFSKFKDQYKEFIDKAALWIK